MKFGKRELNLSYPQIMGVLNVTPDSFYDGGRFVSAEKSKLALSTACTAAQLMVEEGASIIDVGGESTRPGAKPVSLQEEMDRVLPVVERLSSDVDAVVSVDTSSPELMLEAANLGAGLLNDVRALSKAGAIEAAVKAQLPVCLMHMQGTPQTMQISPSYQNVVSQVSGYLSERAHNVIEAGLPRSQVIVDPGFGFGKTDPDNLHLLKHLEQIKALGFPVLVGLSRKSIIGRLLDREPNERLAGSVAFAMLAAQLGAGIIRVHDVAQTRDVIKIFQAFHAA